MVNWFLLELLPVVERVTVNTAPTSSALFCCVESAIIIMRTPQPDSDDDDLSLVAFTKPLTL